MKINFPIPLIADMSRSQLVSKLSFEFKYEKEDKVDVVLAKIADAMHTG